MTVWSLFSIAAFGVALGVLVSLVAWARSRGARQWHRQLEAEYQALKRQRRETTDPRRRIALDVVLQEVEGIRRLTHPDWTLLTRLPTYLRAIAAAYYPDTPEPELRLHLGDALEGVENSLGRLDQLLSRPGLARLRRARVRQLRRAYTDYRRIERWIPFRFGRWLSQHLDRWNRYRLLIWPDPFGWLMFLSQRLTLLVLAKYLLLDIYLYLGRSAVRLYGRALELEDGQDDNVTEEIPSLEELESLVAPGQVPDDPRIRAIREQLIGWRRLALDPPGPHDWWDAVVAMTDEIARQTFPHAARPREEAAIGPILVHIRAGFATLAKTREWPGVKRLYRIRLQRLRQARDFLDRFSDSRTTVWADAVGAAAQTYGAYRQGARIQGLLKSGSPWRWVRHGVSWGVQKALIRLVYGYAFDTTHREVTKVYWRSRWGESGPAEDVNTSRNPTETDQNSIE